MQWAWLLALWCVVSCGSEFRATESDDAGRADALAVVDDASTGGAAPVAPEGGELDGRDGAAGALATGGAAAGGAFASGGGGSSSGGALSSTGGAGGEAAAGAWRRCESAADCDDGRVCTADYPDAFGVKRSPGSCARECAASGDVSACDPPLAGAGGVVCSPALCVLECAAGDACPAGRVCEVVNRRGLCVFEEAATGCRVDECPVCPLVVAPLPCCTAAGACGCWPGGGMCFE